jgi:O-antigen/teichoic acid export membrane protein
VAAPPEAPPATHTLDSADAGARFIRGSLFRVGVYGISLLASLISAPLVIRHLGPSAYGYFATVTAIVFIIGGFTEAGLNALGIREYSTGRPDRTQLLRNLVGLRVTGTAAGVLVAAGIATVLGAHDVVVDGVLVAGLGLIVTITGENYGIPLSADLRVTTVSVLGLLQQLTVTGLYILLVLAGAGVVPLLAATIASGAVLFAGTAVLVRSDVPIIPAFERRVWRHLIKETLPYAMASAVGIIYFREALVLMSAMSTEHEVSYYSAAFRIVEVLAAIPYVLVSAGFPILTRAASKDDSSRLAYAMQRLFDTGLIGGVWMAASIVVGATFGIRVVGGPGFEPSVPVLQIQGLAVAMSFMVALFGSVLLSLRFYRSLLRANAVAVFVATVLSVALIPSSGARGAAIAATSAEASLAVAYAVSLFRSRPALRPSLSLVPRIAAATVVSLGITYAVALSSAASLFVFGGIYFGLLAATRAIPFEVINAVLGRKPPPS